MEIKILYFIKFKSCKQNLKLFFLGPSVSSPPYPPINESSFSSWLLYNRNWNRVFMSAIRYTVSVFISPCTTEASSSTKNQITLFHLFLDLIFLCCCLMYTYKNLRLYLGFGCVLHLKNRSIRNTALNI